MELQTPKLDLVLAKLDAKVLGQLEEMKSFEQFTHHLNLLTANDWVWVNFTSLYLLLFVSLVPLIKMMCGPREIFGRILCGRSRTFGSNGAQESVNPSRSDRALILSHRGKLL